uniref:Osteoclast-stimulating factor 1 n=1 Tax=Nothobranchius pienaari TaxID=704102 RepID=A0A1A8N903_9TELE
MSQFLCLKNIRTFLGVCQERFHLKKNELFEAFELFDVRDFGKVINTLSILSRSAVAVQKGFMPFPLDGSAPDDEIYSGLSDQIDDTVDEDDDLYDFVEDEDNEGDEIYEDLMKTDEQPETQQKTGVDKRECCLQEIRQTEEKYTDTLESILKHFMKPLERYLQTQDIENIFINVKELASTHRSLLDEVRNSILMEGAKTLHQVFVNYKERLLLYGHYCSQVEAATKHLDKLSTVIICKKKSGETFDLKEIIELNHYQIRDETTGEKDNKKWSYLFLLLDCYGKCGYDFFFKTRELKKKWLEQFEMALSNMCPENANANNHDFQMFCFEETTPAPDLSDFLWFAGNMDRTAAKNLLMSRSDGTFLVRQKDAGEFAISIKFNMDIKHIKITCIEGLYRINDKKAFKSLIEMIEFYQQNSLKEYFRDVDTTLHTPYKQPEQSNSSNNTPNTTPGGSIKSFGVARARYDYSARDRTELSLREGDTIKILSKKSHSGWWRGEVYGRVGLFPSNYVDEDFSEYC